ncbi:UDP-N-acetylmuramate--alanine ligase [Sedimentibacter acidaminivorans]|jgi:UDP-N-acetylmuramate--alanine ligase|uniref:UDP-N-acetylmuramate--L-alanine ligase n=1 Tax=Sedimentibacter acidaminivorans TaxID=913099 RepID=A0ABS4G9T2_9FIRM|nr:UDP-N-acetylmuramate--L-alanine ligase [Sedimentibacter acidaminivorans]MBP1924165.1 UDP-N-acetylmuramate--alanine ligase [Sedimentibacter acidaminivorans]
MKNNFNNIYFIGIGGISMSGLAELMLDEGLFVAGSDKNDSHIVKKLAKMGAKIHLNHNSDHITDDIDLVVYTSAISNDNPELLRALQLNLAIMDRAEFLGYVMKNYHNSICVSGTHGKTTTTGMLSSILIETDLEPTIFLGGEMDSIGGNIKHGSNNLLLTEACEYKRNFLKFNPTMELILNIDVDHLDYYKDLQDIKNAFLEYANKLPKSGVLIANVENENLFKDLKCNVATFGKENNADFYATNIKYLPTPSYMLMNKGNKLVEINLQVFGEHNILNSIAASAACVMLGISVESIKKGLENFKGTHRRYEFKGFYKNAVIIDDYAHHPTEMKTTLLTAKTYSQGRVITIFQPHTYSRTIALLDEFAEALKLSDETILLDIYAARETDTRAVHSKDLANKIKEVGGNVIYAKSFEDATNILNDMISNGDTVITMGAGNVNTIAEHLIVTEQ